MVKRIPFAAALKLNEASREALKRCAAVATALLFVALVMKLLGR